MTKQEILKDISFGHRVAEQESDDLARYFVETDQWNSIYSGKVDIVYGPKGSGKSALYTLLLLKEKELRQSSILLAPAENVRGATAFKDLVTDPPASEPEFIALWKLYFASLAGATLLAQGVRSRAARDLLAALEAEGLSLATNKLRARLRAVSDYVRRAFRPESVEAGVVADPTTGLPAGLTGKITFRQPSQAEVKQGYLSVDDLLDAADAAFGEAGLEFWILLDRLDVAFLENPQLEQNALRALFHVYVDMLALNHICPKVFLRSDIWRRITSVGFREASHITRHMTISWDRRTLLHLVISRAVQNKVLQDYYGVSQDEVLSSTESQEAFFYRMVPDQVDVGSRKSTTFDWVLSRATDATKQTAPREVIHLLGALAKAQIRRLETGDSEPPGEELFSRAAFKEALTEVSQVRLEQTLYAEYPNLRRHIERLRGGKTLYSLDALAKIWKVKQRDAEGLAHKLTDVGFFEERANGGTQDLGPDPVPVGLGFGSGDGIRR